MTVSSNFTSQGRHLLAMWLDDPDAALPITLMQFSDVAREDYAGADTMSATPCASAHVTSNIDPNDGTLVRYYAGVEFSTTVNPGALGKTLKEVGLYIEGPDPSQHILMWVGRFPDTLVPAAGQSAATVTLNVTIPVKFENASQIAIVIDNTNIHNQVANLYENAGKAAAAINKLNDGTSSTDLPESLTSVNQKANKSDLDTLSIRVNTKADTATVNSLSTTVTTMKGTGQAKEKANLADTAKLINGLQSGSTSSIFPNSTTHKADKTWVDDQLTNITSALGAKAEQSTVNTINLNTAQLLYKMHDGTTNHGSAYPTLGAVKQKANQADLSNLQTTVSTLQNTVKSTCLNLNSKADLGSLSLPVRHHVWGTKFTVTSGSGVVKFFTSMYEITSTIPSVGMTDYEIYRWPKNNSDVIVPTILDFNFIANSLTAVGHMIVYKTSSHFAGFGTLTYSLGSPSDPVDIYFTMQVAAQHEPALYVTTSAPVTGALCFATRTVSLDD